MNLTLRQCYPETETLFSVLSENTHNVYLLRLKKKKKKIRLNDPTNKIFPFFTSGVSTASSSALGSPWTSGATSVSGAGVSGAAASSGGAASSTQSRVKKESYRLIKTEHTASRALTTGKKKLS